MVANFLKLAGTRGMTALYVGQSLTPTAYDRIATSRWSALEWVDDPQGWTDIGLAYLSAIEGWRGPPDEDFHTLLKQARLAFHKGLSQAPGQPGPWAQLV